MKTVLKDVRVFGKAKGADEIRLSGAEGWSLGLLFLDKIGDKVELRGLKRVKMKKTQLTALEELLDREVKPSRSHTSTP